MTSFRLVVLQNYWNNNFEKFKSFLPISRWELKYLLMKTVQPEHMRWCLDAVQDEPIGSMTVINWAEECYEAERYSCLRVVVDSYGLSAKLVRRIIEENNIECVRELATSNISSKIYREALRFERIEILRVLFAMKFREHSWKYITSHTSGKILDLIAEYTKGDCVMYIGPTENEDEHFVMNKHDHYIVAGWQLKYFNVE
jgi:hypothetical protein